MDEAPRLPPLQRLAEILDIPGEPITDYSWSDVIEAVKNLMALGDEFHRIMDKARARPCAAYDHTRPGPCPNRPHVQGACADHAVMCAMCGKNLSGRGVCPSCLDELAAETSTPDQQGEPVRVDSVAPAQPSDQRTSRATDLDSI